MTAKKVKVEEAAHSATEQTRAVVRTNKRGRPARLDEFTFLPISRQRKWQLRQMAQGGCVLCGQPVVSGHKCLRHMIQSREATARKHGFKTHYNSKSRLLEKISSLPAKHWEYKVVSARTAGVFSDIKSQNALIQREGQDGWNLTAALREPDGDVWFYFKRPEGYDTLASQLGHQPQTTTAK